jgi:hypothetical protein
MDNVLFMQEVDGEKYLSYNDRSFDIDQFPILQLDV